MPVLSPRAEPAALQEALVSQGKAVVRRAQSHGGSYACQQPLLSEWHHVCDRNAAVEGTQAGVTNRLALSALLSVKWSHNLPMTSFPHWLPPPHHHSFVLSLRLPPSQSHGTCNRKRLYTIYGAHILQTLIA